MSRSQSHLLQINFQPYLHIEICLRHLEYSKDWANVYSFRQQIQS